MKYGLGAPASPSLEDSLRVLQEQVTTLQKEIQVRLETSQIEYRNLQGKNELLPANSEESRRWQPEKRMVAWQPMKRTVNVDERAPRKFSSSRSTYPLFPIVSINQLIPPNNPISLPWPSSWSPP